jgi:chemotaxis protein methyltransferase CheR
MQEAIFQAFRDLIYKESGISLKADKMQLLSARTQKRLRELGLRDAEGYLEIIESDVSGAELVSLLDSISTNVTYFFREPAHFDFLNEQFRLWNEQGKTRARIWCAASSSGQEPYTIAMCMREHLDLSRTNCKLMATDLCTKVLQSAISGVYPEAELAKVPANLTKRYFEKEGTEWRASDLLTSLVTFRKLNLVHIPYPMKGPLDIIFCRNVMIYFDLPVRQAIVSEFGRLIPPGGHLVISHSESLMGLDVPFTRVSSSVYQRN